ncbi:MAG: dTMP kinase [Clostridiales bacterium]|nr:dTMP kinase [Clostridiales bacterium]
MNRFIVFEGLDGAGKSTQIKMLTDYLAERDASFEFLHFPRLGEGIIGDMIARFLRGEFGAAEDVNPYLVALIYSQDRNDAKRFLLDCIGKHHYLIVDRYVHSNIAYQCAKVADERQKNELRDWILKLEYEHNSLPKPDITIYLKVPFEFTEKTLKGSREGQDRDYLKGCSDIHESDLELQKNVEKEYLKLGDFDPDFKIIDCGGEDGRLLEPTEISNNIIQLLTEKNLINHSSSSD